MYAYRCTASNSSSAAWMEKTTLHRVSYVPHLHFSSHFSRPVLALARASKATILRSRLFSFAFEMQYVSKVRWACAEGSSPSPPPVWLRLRARARTHTHAAFTDGTCSTRAEAWACHCMCGPREFRSRSCISRVRANGRVRLRSRVIALLSTSLALPRVVCLALSNLHRVCVYCVAYASRIIRVA